MGKQILYRVGQAGKDLGVSSYRIRRLCETGLIDAEFSGNQWQIPAGEVERLKRNGVPSAPKVVDSDDPEASPAPNTKERDATTLLADPSWEMIRAAEEAEMSNRQLTVAKNKLEQNRLRRDEAEIEDFFADREKRFQEQEAAERRRSEEQIEADARTRRNEAAAAERQKFYSEWQEYALRRKPYAAPDEIELDIHAEVLATLAKVDTNERDFVVRRLVDAAIERGLKTWKTAETKRAAIDHVIAELPLYMRYDEHWKGQARKIASEALKDIATGVSREEMASQARTALQPLVVEFRRSQKIEEIINGIRIEGANQDELRQGQDVVREALSELPNGATDRQITGAKEEALAPLLARLAERITREEAQRQRQEAQYEREQIMSSVSWRLPRETSADDKNNAITEISEALDQLPLEASRREMEKVRDQAVEEYEIAYREKARNAHKKAEQARKKADLVAYGLTQILPYAERLIQEFEYDRGETAWNIDTRIEVR
jgi:hypothetical protein